MKMSRLQKTKRQSKDELLAELNEANRTILALEKINKRLKEENAKLQESFLLMQAKYESACDELNNCSEYGG
jgi:hypothetical protein